MKKMMIVCLLVLVGCANNSVYNEEETKQLKKADVYDIANNDCENSDSVKVMLNSNAFNEKHIKSYCALKLTDSEGVNELLDAKVKVKDVQKYVDLSNFHAEKVSRYLAYPANTIKEKVMNVNMDMDLEPYATTTIINDDSDMTLLVNKFNALPEGYVPDDLVDVNYVCVQGEDFSCSTMARMQLRKEAAQAYEQFAKAAQEEGLEIRAIATYRSYDYQLGLYNYNKDLYGVEYADAYYARAGQSEHNSGLAVDITFNGHNYNEIENYEGYEWILNNMHRYGFILRYPKDKQAITKYGYESWHLRYVGKKAAKTIYENKWTLEEYYGAK
ncbi:MAG: D-alanyl-D-alanine carboxypeptidase family protein [Erysipelotrichia bacterium]|nr:D-alanyl-D-alanine carboxypeptidase family protein [Erysipelotrichia bacterium]NCC54677.1 D-alanyl-D-alanine carboxypeptidase family protein [Erysipelotrichia bacterium]